MSNKTWLKEKKSRGHELIQCHNNEIKQANELFFNGFMKQIARHYIDSLAYCYNWTKSKTFFKYLPSDFLFCSPSPSPCRYTYHTASTFEKLLMKQLFSRSTAELKAMIFMWSEKSKQFVLIDIHLVTLTCLKLR